MSLDMASFDSALKEHYTDMRVENMVYKDNPALALISKAENFGGKSAPIPLIYGNPQGRSANFAQAQARGAVTSSKLEDFVLKRVKDYSIATIDNETLEASKGDAHAFMDAATVEIDGAINSLTRSLAVSLFRDGFGSIGQIDASSASTTIQLKDPQDVTNFEVGMELVNAQFSDTGALANSAASVIVTKVNRSTGALTVSANTFASNANYFLFVKGDRQDAASPAAVKMSGFAAWIPMTSPTSALFFQVDRTVDETRLAGLRHDGSSQPIEEALIDLAALIAREGGKPDHCFVSYKKYAELEKSLGSKVQYIDLKVTAEIGFRGIQINGPRGPIKVIPDQNCQSDRAYMLQLDTWKLMSLGKLVRVIDTDGLQMLRQATADGVECRYGTYSNLACKGPGYNGVVKLSA